MAGATIQARTFILDRRSEPDRRDAEACSELELFDLTAADYSLLWQSTQSTFPAPGRSFSHLRRSGVKTTMRSELERH
jgi:hypothetical protein